MDEKTVSEIASRIETAKDIGKWMALDHLKMDEGQKRTFGETFVEIAAQTSVDILGFKAQNMPFAVAAVRKYVACFQAGVEVPVEESKVNLENPLKLKLDKEKAIVDRAITLRGITSAAYPDEEDRELIMEIGREAFLTGRVLAQIGGHRINAVSLGLGTFGLLEDPETKDRVARNIKALVESAGVPQKEHLNSQLNFLLRQNK